MRTRSLLIKCLLLMACLGGALAGHARAELTWTSKQIDLNADARTTVLEAKFHFTNTGKKAVDINKIESSCGCTTAELEKRHYEPGESGDVVARYRVGDQVGRQVKTVGVVTNEHEEPIILTLSILIPEILRITPAFVKWNHNEEPKAKHITLELLQDTPISDISAQSSDPGVNVVLTTLAKGHKYQLDLTPTQTTRLVFATVSIHCIYGEEDKTFHAYATVRPSTSTDH